MTAVLVVGVTIGLVWLVDARLERYRVDIADRVGRESGRMLAQVDAFERSVLDRIDLLTLPFSPDLSDDEMLNVLAEIRALPERAA